MERLYKVAFFGTSYKDAPPYSTGICQVRDVPASTALEAMQRGREKALAENPGWRVDECIEAARQR